MKNLYSAFKQENINNHENVLRVFISEGWVGAQVRGRIARESPLPPRAGYVSGLPVPLLAGLSHQP